MKIVNSSKRYHIFDLKVGDTFEFDNEYWIKTDCGFANKTSCVRLNDGILQGIKDDTVVKPITMEVTVK